MPTRIIITVSNDIVTDQRVRRMSKVLRDNSYHVTIVGRKLKSDLAPDNFANTIRRFRMIFRKGPLFYMFLNLRLFIYLITKKADAIIAVDLDTLLAAVLVKKIKKTILIYDAHEYFTGVPELLSRPRVRSIWLSIERYALPKAEHMITVNSSIAQLYHKDYGVNPEIIRNVSEDKNRSVASRSVLGIKKKDLVLIMQGSINMDRGFKEAIRAVASINYDPDFSKSQKLKLLIAGAGYKLTSLKEYVKLKKLTEDIIFLDRLEWSRMMEYTRMADIGLSIDSSKCINYRYSLPNKIFEYINSGIAIIATALPEIETILNKHKCGLLIESNNIDNIRTAMIKLLRDEKLLAGLKHNSKEAANDYTWEKEGEKLYNFINRAINN